MKVEKRFDELVGLSGLVVPERQIRLGLCSIFKPMT